jgi:hypothetical protein
MGLCKLRRLSLFATSNYTLLLIQNARCVIRRPVNVLKLICAEVEYACTNKNHFFFLQNTIMVCLFY